MRASFLFATLLATSTVFSMLNPLGGGAYWGGSPGYTSSSSSSYYIQSAPQIIESQPIVQDYVQPYSSGFDYAPLDSSTIIGASLTGKKKRKRRAHA